MFPWNKIEVGKGVRECLKRFSECPAGHVELLTGDLLEEIRRFVQQYKYDLNLFTDQKGTVLGTFPGVINDSILLEWDDIGPMSDKSLSGMRWLIFGIDLDLKQLSSQENYIFTRYGLDILVKGDLLTEESAIFYPTVENGARSRGYDREAGYAVTELLTLDPTERIMRVNLQLNEDAIHKITDLAVEKALLVGLELPGNKNLYPLKESLMELEQLATTAGAIVVGQTWQSRDNPHPAFYVGQGKVEEIKYQVYLQGIDLIIFDDELSPAQQRNLEEIISIKVVDRSRLILDIFAQHAHTREGKLQVELAQMKYMLPRLMGQGQVLSRLGGGIGTRGPGETKLEVDRRRIRKRITDLEREIKEVAALRQLHNQGRRLPVVALVGYTNAGKSTLLNYLTNAEVLAEDKLFATLDPTMRKLDLGTSSVLLSDTVGFIQKLPHHLVAAFKATLEEVQKADLLLHIVDASHREYELQMRTVWDVLGDLEVLDKPTITVFNKADCIDEQKMEFLKRQVQPSTVVSARTGSGMEDLFDLIRQEVEQNFRELEIILPYDQGGWIEKLHRTANVIEEDYREEGIYLKVVADPVLAGQIERYQIRR